MKVRLNNYDEKELVLRAESAKDLIALGDLKAKFPQAWLREPDPDVWELTLQVNEIMAFILNKK